MLPRVVLNAESRFSFDGVYGLNALLRAHDKNHFKWIVVEAVRRDQVTQDGVDPAFEPSEVDFATGSFGLFRNL